MRNKAHWDEFVLPKVLGGFSPRLQEDMKKIPYELTKIPAFGSYYIYGGVGSGKTLLAAHMYVQARFKQFIEVLPGKFLFINTYEFYKELKQAFQENTDDYIVLEKFSMATYLVLDDIGATTFTDWQISMMQQLINYRYENMLPTIFTSNLNLDELGAAMGDKRIPSRITRMCEILKKVGK